MNGEQIMEMIDKLDWPEGTDPAYIRGFLNGAEFVLSSAEGREAKFIGTHDE